MQDNLTRNSLNLPTTKIIVKLYDKTDSTADQQISIMSNEKRTVQSAQYLSVLDKQLEIDSRLGYSRSSNGLGYETTFKSPNPQGSCSVIVEDCSNVPEDPNISSGASSGSLGVNSGAKRLGVRGSSASLGVLENKTVSSGSATGNPRNKVALAPGHSLIDWVRLGKASKDLSGVGGKLLEVTLEQLSKHNKQTDAWTVIRGTIYNITPYMDFHPGGVPELMRAAGIDGTTLFDEVHKWVNYESLLSKCIVGKLAATVVHLKDSSPQQLSQRMPTKPSHSQESLATHSNDSTDAFLKCTMTYQTCTLTSCEPVTHNTNLYRIRLPDDVMISIPTGQHIYISAQVQGAEVSHPYTAVPSHLVTAVNSDSPTNVTQRIKDCTATDSADHEFHLMIKIYADGLLTPIIGQLSIGGTIQVSTVSAGDFEASRLDDLDELVMFAAGTGFTPMASLIAHYIQHHTKQTSRRVRLVFFNKEVRDILWRDQLDHLASSTDWFTVHHILSSPAADWTGLVGRIRIELVEKFLPLPSNERNILVCACGPIAFTHETIRLTNIRGYTADRIHAFLG